MHMVVSVGAVLASCHCGKLVSTAVWKTMLSYLQGDFWAPWPHKLQNGLLRTLWISEGSQKARSGGLCVRDRKGTRTQTFVTREATTLNLSAGLGCTEVESWTPARSTSPNSCSTGPAPSKSGKSNLLGGISRDFAGISQRCPKSLRKNKFVFKARPLVWPRLHRKALINKGK